MDFELAMRLADEGLSDSEISRVTGPAPDTQRVASQSRPAIPRPPGDPALGGMTPYEALLAGEREAVLELAMGRPGADATTALISSEESARMRATLGDGARPPYDL